MMINNIFRDLIAKGIVVVYLDNIFIFTRTIKPLEEWRYFLEEVANPVEIWTDYKNLEYFMTTKKLNHQQVYWSLYLVRFNFIFCYYPEQSMGKPDALLWRLDHSNGSSNNKNMVLFHLEFLAIYILERVEFTGVEQNILSEVYKDNCSRDLKEPVTKATQELQCSMTKIVYSLEWSNVDGLLCFQEKIYMLWTLNLYRKIVLL